MESPSGKEGKIAEKVLPFSPDPFGGASIRLNATISVFKGDLFWLHSYLDGKRMARMPIHIGFRRESLPAQKDSQTNRPAKRK
jgi:hypothetical protein